MWFLIIVDINLRKIFNKIKNTLYLQKIYKCNQFKETIYKLKELPAGWVLLYLELIFVFLLLFYINLKLYHL